MNKAKGFLLAVAVAAMAFTLSCKSEDEGGSGSSGGTGSIVSGIGGGGTFTLTGIPAEYNGKYVQLTGATGTVGGVAASAIHGYQSINPMRLSQISNGSVSIPMWVITVGGPVKYSGNTTSSVVTVGIFNNNAIDGKENIPIGAAMFTSPTTFSNGNATRNWNEGRGMNFQSTTKGGSK